jgi:hypothetical protein
MFPGHPCFLESPLQSLTFAGPNFTHGRQLTTGLDKSEGRLSLNPPKLVKSAIRVPKTKEEEAQQCLVSDVLVHT